MNNIQKAFKNKAKLSLRMAAGGLIQPNPQDSGSVGLMGDPADAENAEKTARWRQDDLLKQASYSLNPQPLQQAAAAVTPLQLGHLNSPSEAINAERGQRWREDDLLDKTQYFSTAPQPGRRGLRMAEGGIVRGPGGPTDDDVPMRVSGRDVQLSNTEAVLPAKTVQALGGPKAVEELIEATNGKPPVKGGLRDGGDYATGVVGDQLDPRELRPEFRSQAATPVIEPAVNPGLEAARNTRAAGAMSTMPEAGAPYVHPQAPAAPAAEAVAPKAGLAARGMRALSVLNPVADVAAGVMAAKGLADFTDSFPSLRGQHTAEATDMALAGTPQQAAVENKALAAVDANWEKKHGRTVATNKELSDDILKNGQSTGTIKLPAIDKAKAQSDTAKAIATGRVGATVDQERADEAQQAGLRAAGNMPGQNRQLAAVTQGDTAASEAMGDVADRLTGVSRGSGMGLRGMAQRFDAYTNNDSARAARNAQLQLRGDGARFEKDGNGKLVITNSGDFDGSTKMPYTDVNGKPTAIHTGSMEHRQGLRDAANLKTQLATMQQNRLERNAGEDITDEGLRNYSRHALEAQGRQAAELTKAQIARAPTALDLDKHQLARDQFALETQKAGNAQENAARNFKASQSAQVSKLIDSALDTQAPTTGLKDDELKKAQSKRADLETALYAAHKRMPGDDAEYAASMPGMMRQAKLSVAMRDAIQNRGLWNKITNLGRDPWQTLNAAAPKREGDMFVFDNGFSIPVKEVIGKDADLLAAYEERVNSR